MYPSGVSTYNFMLIAYYVLRKQYNVLYKTKKIKGDNTLYAFTENQFANLVSFFKNKQIALNSYSYLTINGPITFDEIEKSNNKSICRSNIPTQKNIAWLYNHPYVASEKKLIVSTLGGDGIKFAKIRDAILDDQEVLSLFGLSNDDDLNDEYNTDKISSKAKEDYLVYQNKIKLENETKIAITKKSISELNKFYTDGCISKNYVVDFKIANIDDKYKYLLYNKKRMASLFNICKKYNIDFCDYVEDAKSNGYLNVEDLTMQIIRDKQQEIKNSLKTISKACRIELNDNSVCM